MSAPMLSRVDPTLPAVDLHELACPGCGQTLAFLKGVESFLPEQHNLADIECQFNDRYLAAVVFRAQRDAVGLVNP